MDDNKKNSVENKVFFKFSTKRMMESTHSEHPTLCPVVFYDKRICLVVRSLEGPHISQAVLEICQAVTGKLD
ncbi:hypothetical protein [Desulfobacula phenolica]|uniref:Uncharacterized protein n=1 Tax=Desulfobacula phenolica TaxID=90732 RepID=A0A1H2JKX5_9BACT|nr:hypothetical protein [Desulfobacula phenolica]SDU56725.1 hypothetical protein SAMN04487931_11330 [Desulfobacula phenolica]